LHQSLGKHDKALRCVGSFDDLHVDLSNNFEQCLSKLGALIAAIGIELLQEWKQAEQASHHQHATITVLQGRRMDYGVEDQTLCVYKEMALLAFDLFASVEAVGIDAAPPFSALFTLWVSMIAAFGEASPSASSRHFTSAIIATLS
jgi:hypothetical protein